MSDIMVYALVFWAGMIIGVMMIIFFIALFMVGDRRKRTIL